MELKDTKILIKVSPENADLEGFEIRTGEFCTTKIEGKPGTEKTMEIIHAEATLEVAKNLGKKAWEGDPKAKQLNTAWIFQTERTKAAFEREREQAARRRHLNRRGPR